MKVFATRVWNFDPIGWPVITFGLAPNRDRLLNDSQPGDRIIFVGTQDIPTPEPMRGRLLGMAEIGRLAVETLDVIQTDAIVPEEDYDAHGRFKWPKAIQMIRAWRFEPQPLLLDVLEAQLSYAATPMAVELSAADAGAVLALDAVEVELPGSAALAKARLLDQALSAGSPTTGPTPTSWSGLMARDVNRAAFTYAMRFGTTNTWKIGHAVDVGGRVGEVNQHIPPEEVPHVWRAVFQQRWPDEVAAHEMEQRVLAGLTRFRTQGERVRCTEAQLLGAWTSALGA